MLTSIRNRLLTGPIKNVVAYGSPPQSPPYVVIKLLPASGVGRRLEVWGHMMPGQQTFLESYMVNSLSGLLVDWQGTTALGNTYRVWPTQELSGIITANDDGTISMMRAFQIPSILF